MELKGSVGGEGGCVAAEERVDDFGLSTYVVVTVAEWCRGRSSALGAARKVISKFVLRRCLRNRLGERPGDDDNNNKSLQAVGRAVENLGL